MKRSDFILDSGQLTCYMCHKISFVCNVLFINSPNWAKKKKATINPKNTDDNVFSTSNC